MRKKSHTPIFKAQKLWCLKAGQMPKFMKHSGSGYTTVQTPATLTGNGLGSITASNGGPVFASYQFTLGDIQQAATFSSLFDQYMIEEVQFIVVPRSNAIAYNLNSATTQANPFLYICVDRDDNTNLGTVADIQQYDNVIQCNAVTGAVVMLKPSIATALWAGGAFSGYSISGPKWIDIANTNVPHYGVKIACQPVQATSTETISWDIELRYRIAFRNTR